MKTFMLLAVIVLPVGYVVSSLSAPRPVRAQTVEEANATITKTERDLRTTATSTATQAAGIQQGLSSSNHAGLANELQDFNRLNDHLMNLRAELAKDIDEYKTAYTDKLAAFDLERSCITDPATQRSMDVLRRHTEQDMNERVMAAKATLEQLDNVLTKGADLEHAAKCIIIAEELQTHGQDVDAQLKAAKEQANNYAKLTNNLLARINQTLTD